MKPASLYSTFFPALQGKKSKMSSTDPTSSILLTDTAKEVKNKINKYAFSGGRQTVEEHRKLGADLEVDVPYQYLRFFLEDDDELEDIRSKYASGELLTGEVKAVLVKIIQDWLKQFQDRRAKVTDEDVKNFMEHKKITPYPKAWEEVMQKRAAEKAAVEAKKKAEKEEAEKLAAIKKAEKAKKDAAKKQASKDFAIAKKKKQEEEKAA